MKSPFEKVTSKRTKTVSRINTACAEAVCVTIFHSRALGLQAVERQVQIAASICNVAGKLSSNCLQGTILKDTSYDPGECVVYPSLLYLPKQDLPL